jgi:hypothetical protein
MVLVPTNPHALGMKHVATWFRGLLMIRCILALETI